eukprot:COSAG02_NODE_6783_length_3362_cov_599.198897_1_plen_77_part_00
MASEFVSSKALELARLCDAAAYTQCPQFAPVLESINAQESAGDDRNVTATPDHQSAGGWGCDHSVLQCDTWSRISD